MGNTMTLTSHQIWWYASFRQTHLLKLEDSTPEQLHHGVTGWLNSNHLLEKSLQLNNALLMLKLPLLAIALAKIPHFSLLQ